MVVCLYMFSPVRWPCRGVVPLPLVQCSILWLTWLKNIMSGPKEQTPPLRLWLWEEGPSCVDQLLVHVHMGGLAMDGWHNKTPGCRPSMHRDSLQTCSNGEKLWWRKHQNYYTVFYKTLGTISFVRARCFGAIGMAMTISVCSSATLIQSEILQQPYVALPWIAIASITWSNFFTLQT